MKDIYRSLFALSPLILLATLLPTTLATDDSDSPSSKLLSLCTAPAGEDDAVTAATLLNDGADIDVRNPTDGQSCLMASTLRGKINLVRLLLKNGADKAIPEKQGYTLAHGAGFQGRPDVMKLLHENDVDVLMDVHTDGFLPFHRACWGREKRHAETVEYLLGIGADPSVKGNNGMTCEDMTNNEETKKVLASHSVSARQDL
mmetsp:Transcript_28665/g.34914  ORF Transcript_28665/g.34914 Transcript_28665/m.34914 type:complete len:202 (+) Transcript_28665:37-642(+)